MKTFLKGLGLITVFIAIIFAVPFLMVLWPIALVLLLLFVPGLAIGVILAKKEKEN